jgi:hypothetical protein
VKIICLILSLYVIILSAKPCCTDNDCVALAKEKTSKQAPNEKGCFGCSPFFTCGSCVGFVTGKPVVVSLPMIEESVVNEYAAYRQPRITKMSSSIWLPPKLS